MNTTVSYAPRKEYHNAADTEYTARISYVKQGLCPDHPSIATRIEIPGRLWERKAYEYIPCKLCMSLHNIMIKNHNENEISSEVDTANNATNHQNDIILTEDVMQKRMKKGYCPFHNIKIRNINKSYGIRKEKLYGVCDECWTLNKDSKTNKSINSLNNNGTNSSFLNKVNINSNNDSENKSNTDGNISLTPQQDNDHIRRQISNPVFDKYERDQANPYLPQVIYPGNLQLDKLTASQIFWLLSNEETLRRYRYKIYDLRLSGFSIANGFLTMKFLEDNLKMSEPHAKQFLYYFETCKRDGVNPHLVKEKHCDCCC